MSGFALSKCLQTIQNNLQVTFVQKYYYNFHQNIYYSNQTCRSLTIDSKQQKNTIHHLENTLLYPFNKNGQRLWDF